MSDTFPGDRYRRGGIGFPKRYRWHWTPTDPKIFEDPAPTAIALQFVRVLIDSPSGTWLGSRRATWQTFASIVEGDSAVRGDHVPDAYLASLAIANGARLATADRGFARYPNLDWFDPGA